MSGFRIKKERKQSSDTTTAYAKTVTQVIKIIFLLWANYYSRIWTLFTLENAVNILSTKQQMLLTTR